MEPPAARTGTEPEATPSGAPAGDDELAERLRAACRELTGELERVIVGQPVVIEQLLVALFGGGHSILVGVPGLAKTLLVSTLSELLSLRFKRIQFTPDLMPADITGTDVIEENPETGEKAFRFVPGPVFANLVLADEVNRAPPKTQAALLEAMQEQQVTVGDRTYPLPTPFFVVATQNPVEQEGTYHLPEAQLDRFLLAIHVDYPSAEDELEIVKRGRRTVPDDLPRLLSAERIAGIQDLVPRVPTADHVYRFGLELARRSRPDTPDAPDFVRENVSLGVGPRAAQDLLLSAKARALIRGRLHCSLEDVSAVAEPALAHRIVTNFRAAASGVTNRDIVRRLLEAIPRPIEGGEAEA